MIEVFLYDRTAKKLATPENGNFDKCDRRLVITQLNVILPVNTRCAGPVM